MKRLIFTIVVCLTTSVLSLAQASATPPLTDKDYVRIEADSTSGFTYPYYLYTPPEVTANAKKTHTILVLPNNTGKVDDDVAVHEADVKRRMSMSGQVASLLKVAVLMPVFPRPASNWQIYTQALDRDSMVTDKKE